MVWARHLVEGFKMCLLDNLTEVDRGDGCLDFEMEMIICSVSKEDLNRLIWDGKGVEMKDVVLGWKVLYSTWHLFAARMADSWDVKTMDASDGFESSVVWILGYDGSSTLPSLAGT